MTTKSVKCIDDRRAEIIEKIIPEIQQYVEPNHRDNIRLVLRPRVDNAIWNILAFTENDPEVDQLLTKENAVFLVARVIDEITDEILNKVKPETT